MKLATNWLTTSSTVFQTPKPLPLLTCRIHENKSVLPFSPYPFACIQRRSLMVSSKKKKKNVEPEPILKPSVVQEVAMDDDEEDEIILDEFEDEEMGEDDNYFDDDYFVEDPEPFVGDGSGGGGISLAGTLWDKKALAIAEEVASSFNGELGIYAFKTGLHGSIQIRIERLTNKSGSPSMMDVEVFANAYRTRLDEAKIAGSIPDSVTLEVSSPGVERLVMIPKDLDRFKERPMFVKYVTEEGESEGVLRVVSVDLETQCCTWGVADVRVNREKAGKGRPLSKKQREWRLETPFDTLQLVRVYSEC